MLLCASLLKLNISIKIVKNYGWEDPLEKRMATHFSFLAWRIPGSLEESDITEQVSLSLFHEYSI